MMRKRFILRVRVILILLAAVALLFLARLYFLQVVYSAEYREEANSQYIETASDIEDRGSIFFTDKHGVTSAAAAMESGSRIAIQPDSIEDAEETYASLSAIIPISRDRFFTSAAKKGDPYEEVATRVKEAAAAAISELDLPGVTLVRDRWRFYPAGERAAHVLGFVGYRGDTKAGQYGLERYWEDTLARDSSSLYVNFFAEIFLNVKSLLSADEGREGDIVTTIEPSVQRQLEEVLMDINTQYNPKQVGGIVMDPKTGAIVAMANLPTFDPNTYNEVEDPAVFSNPLVESVYELGSIMKPLTMAAGIDSSVVTPNTTYNDTGCIEKSGYRVCNYDFKARGVVPMQEVLSQSLNVGASFVADKMGKKTFGSYLKAFGLDEETGIDVPNEVHGSISALTTTSDVDYTSASFGQAMSVTPIGMTRALATLANGGVLVRPHIVSEIRYPSGLRHETVIENDERVLQMQTVEEVTRMLVEVYDDALLGGDLKMEHYSIAAKTGTAQIAIPGGGGYYADRYLHSFFGYFPAYEPKFIVFLYTLEPQGVQYASNTLAHPFYELTQYLINYYSIPPDR